MRRFFTASGFIKPSERLRAGLGACLGLLVTGLVGLWFHRRFQVPLGLIAPLGASSVLLFAVPASPLAQPWSILGGNLLAAFVGVGAVLAIPQTELAAGVAVGLSIVLMATFRCVHPPSGAVALTAVLGGAKSAGAGGFILWSVGVNSLMLLACALLFHAMTGHIYPEFLRPHVPVASPAQEAATERAINEVLEASDDMLDISSAGLLALYDRISLRLAERRHEALDCRSIMSRAPEALSPDTSLSKGFEAVLASPDHAALVTDESARVIGMVTIADFNARTDLSSEPLRITLPQRLRNAAKLRSAPHQVVGDIMQRGVAAVNAGEPASRAIVALVETRAPLLPVISAAGRLIGVVTRTRAFELAARQV